jgi:hypothetical protein
LDQKPQAVLADRGYLNGPLIEQIQAQCIEAYVALSAEAYERRRYDLRPENQRREKPRPPKAPVLVAMEQKLRSPEGHQRYLRRQASIEPVFGIIKRVLGFGQFSLRGLQKVTLEWNLVCLAYNLKRLHKLRSLKNTASAPITPRRAAGPVSRIPIFTLLWSLSAKRNLRSLSRQPAVFELCAQTALC